MIIDASSLDYLRSGGGVNADAGDDVLVVVGVAHQAHVLEALDLVGVEPLEAGAPVEVRR
jgi:hypothetical protein